MVLRAAFAVMVLVVSSSVASAQANAASGQPKSDDKKATETKGADAKAADAKGTDAKVGDAKAKDSKGETAKSDAAKSAPAKSDDPAVANFEKQLGEWRKLLAQMREAQLQYQTSKPDQRAPILQKFNEMVKEGTARETEIKKAAEAAYLAAPNTNDDVSNFVLSMVLDAVKRDNFEEARRLGQMLLDKGNKSKGIEELMCVAAFSMNDFDAAQEHLKKTDGKVADPRGTLYAELIPEYQKKWKKEQEIRAAEGKANDLPRVRIKTDEGDIVVELFENEAPKTVGNFVSLVDKGFYNGTPFHRVLPGFMAQGGDPKGDGSGGPGYTIPCECYESNHRLHFRGSLSMAKQEARDTGGSQFFLTFAPTGHLDGKHTVFGRIVEGLDVLTKLQRRDPMGAAPPEPDKIIEAKVERKRDHAYEPTKIPESGPAVQP
jgi:cyclophilin family peptidyl-prolyl cis-trans isomerase